MFKTTPEMSSKGHAEMLGFMYMRDDYTVCITDCYAIMLSIQESRKLTVDTESLLKNWSCVH